MLGLSMAIAVGLAGCAGQSAGVETSSGGGSKIQTSEPAAGRLEDAVVQLQAIAAALDRAYHPSNAEAVERFERAVVRLEQALAALTRSDNPESAAVPQAPAVDLDLNALRALTLLTEIAVELDIADSLLDLGAQHELGVWPLTDETAEAVRMVRLHLLAYNSHLLRLRASIEPFGAAEPAQELTVLLDRLYEELEVIQGAMGNVVTAHVENIDAAPALPDLDRARQILDELMSAVEALILPGGASAALPLVDMPWRAFIMLDHMYHATIHSCLAMNCTGDDRYGAMTSQERTALRYTASEIEVLLRHTSPPPPTRG